MADKQDQVRLVLLARSKGMADREIPKDLVEGTGGEERRRIIVEWADALGLSASDALRVSRDAGLIPSAHPPRRRKGKPRQKAPENTGA